MSAPAVRAHPEGAVLKVRVTPGSRKEGITGVLGDALKISVRPPAERGKANKAALRLLASSLERRPGDLRLLRGATSRDKDVLFTGLDPAVLAERLRGILVTLDAR